MAEIPDNIKKTLDLFLKDIQPFCSLDKVILFGSLAKGKAQAGSDIDLAIFSKSVNKDNRLSLMSKFFTKVTKHKLDIQPLVFSFQDFISPDSSFIQKEIKEKGIVLK